MKTKLNSACLRAASKMIGLAMVAGFLPSAVHALTLSLDPTPPSVSVGDSFSLSLRIAGLGNQAAPSLGGFSLTVNLDAGLVQFDNISFGDPALGDMLTPSGIEPSVTISSLNLAGDSLELYALSMDTPENLDLLQPSSFTLATLHFTALSPGNASLALADVILGDSEGDPIPSYSIQNAMVQITGPQSMPEGGPAWAAAISFGVLILAHRKLKSNALSLEQGPRHAEFGRHEWFDTDSKTCTRTRDMD